jgi:hypothetical protein
MEKKAMSWSFARPGGVHEGPLALAVGLEHHEVQHVLIEADGARGVPHVEHGVVQASDRHP